MKNKITIEELFILTLNNHWSENRYVESGRQKEVVNTYNRHIINFATYKIDKLSAKTIRNWHANLIDTPFSANRALEVLSKMYTYAIEQEFIPQNTNPCAIIRPHLEKKRKRFATADELKKILDILDKLKTKKYKKVLFIYLLIFTGARPRSIERAKWSEIKTITHDNQTFGILTFNGKSTAFTGEDEQVIIPPNIMELLLKMPLKKELLLGIKMPRCFWDKVRKEAGCPDLWARDFRRTFATIGLSNNESSGVIGELLNHRNANTTKIYTQLIQNKKLDATKNIAGIIQKIGGLK